QPGGPGRGGVGVGFPPSADGLRHELRAHDAGRRRRRRRVPPQALTVSHLLSVVTFLPALGGLVLLFVPRTETGVLRRASLAVSVAAFVLSVPLYFRFDGNSADYQFEEFAAWLPSLGAGYHVGIDGISLLLVLLTTFLTPLALLGSWHAVEDRVK